MHWWTKLNPIAKKRYIHQHPNSKYAKMARADAAHKEKWSVGGLLRRVNNTRR